MKTLQYLCICLIFLLFSCNTTKKLYESKSYEEVIGNLIIKSDKHDLNEEQIEMLSKSYHQANENDFKRIMELKKSGQANIWPEIYERVCNINRRQNNIMVLSDELKESINFIALDLSEEIKNSKEKAELFLSVKANYLLNNPNTENIKEARLLVNQLHSINPSNKNLDNLRLKLVIIPYTQILLKIAAPYNLNLPNDFAQLALDFDDNTIYGVPFDVIENDEKKYDLIIRIMIEEKNISPDRIDAVSFEENKGDLVAKVTDKTLSKTAGIKGNIEFVDVKNNNILINTPFNISSKFIHSYAEVSGDKSACSEHTLELLNMQVVDFPSDEALLKDVARKLNDILKSHYQKK